MQAQTAIAGLGHQSWVTFQGVLELFGANVFDARPALEAVFVWLHLAGAIGVICALVLALARFFRSTELLIPAFAAAILINVASYMFSLHALDLLGAREIAAVLPLGAVLAGRMLADPLLNLAAAGAPAPAAAARSGPAARRRPGPRLAAARVRRHRRGLPRHAGLRRGAIPGSARQPAAGLVAGRARAH